MSRRVGTLRRRSAVARGARLSLVALVLLSILAAAGTSATKPASAAEPSDPAFSVVGRVPLFDGQTPPSAHELDGWLVLDPGTRRGYQIFRPNSTDTTIASFDLDSYQHRRTVTLRGVAVAGTCPVPPCTSVGSTNAPGDVIHAVDQQNGKLYLAGLTTTPTTNGNSTDLVRNLSIMEIDEAKFDGGEDTSAFVRHLRVPPTQTAELTGRDLYGLEFFREGSAGKLLLLFSTPPGSVTHQAHDHWLAQWDVASGFGDWTYLLTSCARAVLISAAGWAYQLPILHGQHYIYLGCQASHGIAAAVRIPLGAGGAPDPDVTKQQAFPLPRTHSNILADPASERLLFQTDLNGSSWWVFDGPSGSWVGVVGSSLWSGYPISAGIDQTTGRLYTLVPDHTKGQSTIEPVEGGFGFTDVRLPLVPQTRNVLPELDYPGQFLIAVDPAAPGRDRQVFVRRGSRILGVTPQYPSINNDQPRPLESDILVIRDREPVPVIPSFGDIDQLTIDRPEAQGVTEVGFNGVSRGFGSRVLLTGGVTAAVTRQLDEDQFVNGVNVKTSPMTIGGVTVPEQNAVVPGFVNACYRNDRELVLGSSEAKSSDLAASARSVALVADESTKADLGEPGARCPAPGSQAVPNSPTNADGRLPKDNQQFLAQMIDSKAGQQWDRNGDGRDDYTSSCSGDEDPGATHAERDGQQYDARATCDQTGEAVSATSSAAMTPSAALPIRVADSSVETSVTRDPDLGIVSTVVATVRGLDIAGAGTIGLIQTKATSFARGRSGTAHTEFSRTFCGVSLPNLQRSACGDPAPAVKALNTLIGKYGEARLREPDPDYMAGSPGGYQAAIQRDRRQAFTDRFVTRDDSNAVPGLELIFYNNDSPTHGAGRQVFQFAGVEASSSYAIKCLLGKQTDGSDCNAPPDAEPSNLTLLLTDEHDNPLKGGVFKVHQDVNGDGTLGVDDRMIENGTCATDGDGTGDCSWDGLEPGGYLVEQTAAPAGYTTAETLSLTLGSGQQTHVHFFNVRAVAGALVGLVDTDRKPLAGGGFELYQDDGDGKSGPADRRYAACTTDERGLCQLTVASSSAASAAADAPTACFGRTADGKSAPLDENLARRLKDELGVTAGGGAAGADSVCVAEVPLGKYVLHQSSAPDDHVAADDVPVDLALPGAIAFVVFTNGLTEIAATAAQAATPADPGEARREIPATESVIVDPGSAAPQPIVHSEPLHSGGGPVRRLVDRLVSAPASAVRFLFSHPGELGLMATVWIVIWLPCYLAERRRVLHTLRNRSSLPSGATVT